MKKLLTLIIFLTISFSCFAGKVVLLRGSGCVGKTSTCRALLALDNSWRVIDEDAIYYKEAVTHWRQGFPEEFAVLDLVIDPQNLFHTIFRNQVLFKANAEEEAKTKAIRAIKTMQEKINRANQEKPENAKGWNNALRDAITARVIEEANHFKVIVDTWFLKPAHIEQIAKVHSVINATAYCPFAVLVERTLKRNYDACLNSTDISSIRYFHQALGSFMKRYHFTQTCDGSIDVLNKNEVCKALAIVEYWIRNQTPASKSSKEFPQTEFTLEEFQEYSRELLSAFKEREQMHIVPTDKVDLILRTDQKDARECARQLLLLIS
jgi:hypothetical protein